MELSPSQKKNAEKIMNDMAAQGWEVVSTTSWSFWRVSLLITFSREKPEEQN